MGRDEERVRSGYYSMYDYKQRSNTRGWDENVERVFSEPAVRCDHCSSFVSEEDETCWNCKGELNG